MSEKIVKFPSKELPTMFGAVEPCDWWSVVIEGRAIPLMRVRKSEGKIEVEFDGRWIYIFEDETEARYACSFAAQALAVGRGYSHLGAKNKDRPFAPEVIIVGEEQS